MLVSQRVSANFDPPRLERGKFVRELDRTEAGSGSRRIHEAGEKTAMKFLVDTGHTL
jgi:hypothetical protein